MAPTLLPAAQYLRMSTDHQQYSLDNQADAISRYATDHDFTIVKTYSDAARSGLRLKNRSGLQQLLKDVVGGDVEYRAILVYDVSRWGRFQDADESAHYEYLCKSAGIPIHYCAELFANDNSVSGLILKALKRTMAGEYSRELSVKVRAGLFRLAKLGYKLGGTRKYGLRRRLLDAEGKPKQFLADGERKSIVNDRVTYVPGPPKQKAIVRRIFQEFADEKRCPNAIARRLNQEGIPYLRGATWKSATVRNMLRDSYYVGTQVWGRTTAILSAPAVKVPPHDWAVCAKAFKPVVEEDLFQRAKHRFENLTMHLSDEQLLEKIRDVYKVHGHLTGDIIEKSWQCPGLSTYMHRFGGLLNVYTRVGYDAQERSERVGKRQRLFIIRSLLIAQLLQCFPGQVEIARKSERFRGLIRCRKTGRLVSLVIGRRPSPGCGTGWLAECPVPERKRTVFLALLDQQNDSVEALFLVQKLPLRDRHIRIRESSEFLRSGKRLGSISEFLDALKHFKRK